jgi:hypothetical protein
LPFPLPLSRGKNTPLPNPSPGEQHTPHPIPIAIGTSPGGEGLNHSYITNYSPFLPRLCFAEATRKRRRRGLGGIAVNLRLELEIRRLKKFPLLLKEGWPGRMIINVLQRLIPAGVVDFLLNFLPSRFLDFKKSYNAASAEVELFLRDDLKDLRPFLLKRLLLFIVPKVRRVG